MSESIERGGVTRLGLVTRVAYVGLIVIATLTSLHLDPSLADASGRLWRALHPRLIARDVVDGVRNVALFGGLGVLWIATMSRPSVRGIARVTLLGAAISLSVETTQLFSPTRTSSLIDVATNTFGALAGATAMWLSVRLVRARPARPRILGAPMSVIAVPYLGAVLCEIFTPLFRQEHVPDILGSRLAVALSTIPPFSVANIPWLDAVLVLPAGALSAALVLEEVNMQSISLARRTAVLGGGALLCAAELAHGVGGGLIRLEAVAIHLLAFVLGALLGPALVARLLRLREGQQRLATVLVVYSVLLAVWTWRPFRPRVDRWFVAQQVGPSHLIPLNALANQVSLFSVGHLGNIFLLFVPLGVIVVTLVSLRFGAGGQRAWTILASGLVFPCFLELGHIVLADRTFDVTNAIVEVAGVCIGWSLAKGSREVFDEPNRVRGSILFAVSES